ncbi:MAG: hypothetical protein WC449_05280 [Candidatus Paceibacterota bacterium]
MGLSQHADQQVKDIHITHGYKVFLQPQPGTLMTLNPNYRVTIPDKSGEVISIPKGLLWWSTQGVHFFLSKSIAQKWIYEVGYGENGTWPNWIWARELQKGALYIPREVLITELCCVGEWQIDHYAVEYNYLTGICCQVTLL